MSLPESVFVHPQALCESETVGEGTRIWAFAHVMKGSVLGAGCNICDHAFVESGAKLGDRVTVKNAVLIWDGIVIEDEVFLGPGACFTNVLNPRAAHKRAADEFKPTLVRRGATVGANATIICGVTLHEHAFVAAGAVVNRDVPPHALVAGNPARLIGHMCERGERLSFNARGEAITSYGQRYAKCADGLVKKL